MDINAKIKLLAETMSGYSVIVDSSNGANVELSKVSMPCILIFIQDTGEFLSSNSHYRDSVNIKVAVLNKIPKGFKESDVESMRYDLKNDMILFYHKLKFDFQFKINTESVKYEIVYDEFDDNLIGVTFTDNVKERVGLNLSCETPDSIIVAPTSISFCQKVSECSSIVSINQLLDDLQAQIDNLPTTGNQNLAQVLAVGNATNEIDIVSNNGLASLTIKDLFSRLKYDSSSLIELTSLRAYITNPTIIDLYAPSVTKNGVEIATVNDLTTPTLQEVVTESPIINDPITSLDGNTFLSISNLNLNLSTDGFLNLDGAVVNKNGQEIATQDFVDNRVQSNIKIIGDWDATSGSYPLADESNTTPFIVQWGAVIKQGFAFRVGYGQAGTVDGFYYENGDVVYSLIDSPTDNSSDWGDLDHNLQQATESLRGTAKIVTAAIIADETSTDDERIVTTKKLWANFWTRVLAIAHTFSAKITFTTAPRFNSASASQYLKVDANKDLESTSSIPMSDINITITDYASTSTITGFSSFTTKIIQVVNMGGYDVINFDIAGTSNATTLAFTIPNSLSSSAPAVSAIIHSLSGATNGSGLAQLAISLNTVNCFFNVSAAAWTGSGSKRVRGTIFVQK